MNSRQLTPDMIDLGDGVLKGRLSFDGFRGQITRRMLRLVPMEPDQAQAGLEQLLHLALVLQKTPHDNARAAGAWAVEWIQSHRMSRYVVTRHREWQRRQRKAFGRFAQRKAATSTVRRAEHERRGRRSIDNTASQLFNPFSLDQLRVTRRRDEDDGE